MSQKIVIGIVAAVLFGGIGFFVMKQSSPGEAGDLFGQPSQNEILSGTFRDLLSLGNSMQCEFSGTDPDTGVPTSGKVYVSGERYASEVITAVEGQMVTFNMIQAGGVMYMWSDVPEVVPAMRFDLTSFEDSPMFSDDDVPTSPVEWFDEPETDIEYSCRRWVPRNDVFVPPAEIEFMNPFAGLEQLMGDMGDFESMMTDEMRQMMQGM